MNFVFLNADLQDSIHIYDYVCINTAVIIYAMQNCPS